MADTQRTRETSPQEAPKTDRHERDAPGRDDRARSRSPRNDRAEHRPRRRDAGFKWKEKRRDDDDDNRRRDDRHSTLQRGYKDHYKPRSRSPRRVDRDEEVKPSSSEKKEGKEKKDKKEKKTVPARPTEPMIIVYVNDRLGTKKAIPCFASDPIKDFKVIVASMIGRQPHEILLKRQGERPFKDQLTLQDYGVSNNVQLDLEVDTGD